RFALNVTPTSIKDFKPVHYDMARQLRDLGFIMRTEILWYKQTMRRRTAWGSFRRLSNPHIVPSWEYVLVFSKGSWTLPSNKADAAMSRSARSAEQGPSPPSLRKPADSSSTLICPRNTATSRQSGSVRPSAMKKIALLLSLLVAFRVGAQTPEPPNAGAVAAQ